MSYIPSHAMPHTYVHDEAEDGADKRTRRASDASLGTMLKIAGAALAGLLVYRVLR